LLSSLTIQNYKSLHEVTLSPPPFFTVVGANAAGKTNFADAIEFLSMVARSGLAAALSEKGGYENVCFRRQRRSKGAITLGCVLRTPPFELEMRFSFRAQKEAIRSGYTVESEHLRLSIENQSRMEPYLEIHRKAKDVQYEISHQRASARVPLPPSEFFKNLLEKAKPFLRDDDLLLWTYLRGLPPFGQILGELSRFRVFQIAPSHARKAGAASGNQELGKCGENLPGVLDWLKREYPKGYERLLSYAQLAVPTIERIETDYVETRELGLFLKERGIQRRLFASELSDGTLRTLAMFLPLIDPRIPLVVIEEPENSIHPWVVRTFVEACRACSKEKQIILTTHSPVLVSKLEPNELFVAERKNGETTVFSAASSYLDMEEVIRKGIQDLGSYWDSGVMGAVPTQPEFEFMNEKQGNGRPKYRRRSGS